MQQKFMNYQLFEQEVKEKATHLHRMLICTMQQLYIKLLFLLFLPS